jgi:hypothetical protein
MSAARRRVRSPAPRVNISATIRLRNGLEQKLVVP